MSACEPMDRYLSPEQAKRFYHRLGPRQDWQAFYENPAINELIAHATFDSAHSLFEFGNVRRLLKLGKRFDSVATMVLSEALGLSLFLVLRGGIA